MYEDYLEEFIFKTAKLIAKKLFGKYADEKEDEVDADEPSTDQCEDLNAGDEVTKDSITNENVDESEPTIVDESGQDNKADKTDENEFEILENQKPLSDGEKADNDDPDCGKIRKKNFSSYSTIWEKNIKFFIDPEVAHELDKLILETKEKFGKIAEAKNKSDTVSRVEFDAIHDGLSDLHFHLTLFLLLTILALLNIPSVITWANDYQ